MILYTTVEREGQAEQTIERSRFIGHVRPVETREEAEAFLQEIRKRHRQANHNVPAFLIGKSQELQWTSDDGEPQGSSGAPILQMIVKEGLTNLAVVVTRYFGGIKLGPGGLVRAYTSTAKLALDEAGLADIKEINSVLLQLDYSQLGKVQNRACEGTFQIREIQYLDLVHLTILVEPEELSDVRSWFSDLTSGDTQAAFEHASLVPVKVPRQVRKSEFPR